MPLSRLRQSVAFISKSVQICMSEECVPHTNFAIIRAHATASNEIGLHSVNCGVKQ